MKLINHTPEVRHRRLGSLVLLGVCLALAQNANAQEETTTPQSGTKPAEEPAAETPWSGPDTSDGFDWIELTSGEWLKGDFKALYRNVLEFDSDKLDLLELDWEDVRQVVTERPHMVRSEDKDEFSGMVRIDETNVWIIDYEGETNVFERATLVSVVEGAPKEINYWSFKLGAGVTVQKGNVNQSDFNLNARIQRRTTANRFNLDYLGVSTVIDDVETANNHRVTANFDVFVSRRFFIRPIFAEYNRDQFKNINHQGLVGTGVGYTLIDTSRTEWDVFGGAAYQYTRFTSVLPGEDPAAQTPAFVAGTVYDTELTKWMDLYTKYTLNLLNQRSGTYTHHAKVGLEIELTSILDFDISAIWDRTQTPQERDDGSVPEQDDFRFTLGLSLDF
jgi:hypothetical protein